MVVPMLLPDRQHVVFLCIKFPIPQASEPLLQPGHFEPPLTSLLEGIKQLACHDSTSDRIRRQNLPHHQPGHMWVPCGSAPGALLASACAMCTWLVETDRERERERERALFWLVAFSPSSHTMLVWLFWLALVFFVLNMFLNCDKFCSVDATTVLFAKLLTKHCGCVAASSHLAIIAMMQGVSATATK